MYDHNPVPVEISVKVPDGEVASAFLVRTENGKVTQQNHVYPGNTAMMYLDEDSTITITYVRKK